MKLLYVMLGWLDEASNEHGEDLDVQTQDIIWLDFRLVLKYLPKKSF